MSKRTVKFDDIEVDEQTLYIAMEEAQANTPVTHGRMLLSTGVMVAFCFAVWIADLLDSRAAAIVAILIVASVVFATILMMLLGGPSRRRCGIRRALNRRGIRMCVECGYNLRALPSEARACPECGAACEVVAADVAAAPGNKPPGGAGC